MFWIAFAGGFACGIFAAIVLLFCGALWAMSRQPFDDGEDEHAEALGIGAVTHFEKVV
jgi:4-hydroxybenzoate polyprenyltransferase